MIDHAAWQSCSITNTLSRVVQGLAGERQTFTADDVWDAFDELDLFEWGGDHRVLGAVMNIAVRAGRIQPTGRYVRSRRRRSPIMVWRSLQAPPRTCAECGGPINEYQRIDAKFCSPRCRYRNHALAQQRAAAAKLPATARPTPPEAF